MKKITTLLLFSFFGLGVYAQTESQQYTQVINNLGWVNPSYYGLTDVVNAGVMYRKQWEGFEKAPKSVGFDVNAPFRKIGFGFGLQGNFESIGLHKNNMLALNANTGVKLSENSRLLFGLSAGVLMKRYDLGADANIGSGTGMEVAGDYNHDFFTAGFGLTYAWKDLRVGASGSLLLRNKEQGDTGYNVYGFAEYNFRITESWGIRPVALYSYNNDLEGYADAGVIGSFRKWVDAGVSYRTTGSVNILAQLNILEYFSIGYSYDISVEKVSNLNNGSHEISLRVFPGRFGK